MPDVGEVAPEFTLKGTRGDTFVLREHRGKNRVMLIFYPKDQTSG